MNIENLGSSIYLATHKDENLIAAIENTITTHLDADENQLNNLSFDKYRQKILNIQDLLNSQDFGRKIVRSIFLPLCSYLSTDKVLIQSNIYLRASRPAKPSEQESIGWHRETFYGANMERAINIWTPIKGVDSKNTIQYVPDSHLIADRDILTEKISDQYTAKFSDGHKLGFQYEPKKIIGGVNFAKKKKLLVPHGSSAIFDGNLIHGAAENMSKSIPLVWI